MLETGVLILIVCLGVYGLLRWTRRPHTTRGQEAHWEERVLALTRGNRGAMERAVTARRKKFPLASRTELLKMVHDEYLRDRE